MILLANLHDVDDAFVRIFLISECLQLSPHAPNSIYVLVRRKKGESKEG